MADFNKRIFGSDIDPKIKNKLIARQALAEDPNPNDSVQFTKINGKNVDINEAIGNHNFKKDDMRLFELSSRTPWARAWVAVEIYLHDKKITEKFIQPEKEWEVRHGEQALFDHDTPTTYIKQVETGKYKTAEGITQIEKINTMEKKVYVLGDHNYNSFSATQNPHNPIQEGDKSLFETYLELLKAGELLPGTSFQMFEKNYLDFDADVISKINKKILEDKKREGLAALMIKVRNMI